MLIPDELDMESQMTFGDVLAILAKFFRRTKESRVLF
jgi:hypothetical protein